jgi:alkanesulfonate monooxygenase SsuD/methylene tetrahydromethanopterin reductase-like flavin-dependent oxidoreductase (luciferase family)
MLAAMAARTTNVRFTAAALIAPFHDPLRLAEDLIVLDILSKGRVDLIVAGGYVHEEFAMFGVPMSERGQRVTEVVEVLRSAFSGEPFDYRGRRVQLTPTPFRPGGPSILLGGSSKPAAERAARIADGFIPSKPEVWTYYREESQRLGHPDPGPCPIGENEVVALATNPDEGWEKMAPFFLHETNAYGVWQAQDDIASPFHTVADFDELHTRAVRRGAEGRSVPLCLLPPNVRWHAGRAGLVKPEPVRARGASGVRLGPTAGYPRACRTDPP